jgi:Tol biopolymer transport system component
MQVKLFCFLIITISIIYCGCSENSTNPESEEIPLDGRGGGVIAYCYQPMQNGIHQIFAINADGSENKKLIESTIGLNHHDWSPDGQKIACVGYIGTNNSTWSIHVFDTDGTNIIRLTSQSDIWDSEPAWSPDGTQIAFTRMYPNQNLREELWVMDANGGNQSYIGIQGFAAKWSSDGTRFIYSPKVSGNYEIYTCQVSGTDIQQITNTTINEWFPIWSPNDSLIAFNAYPTGDYRLSELYIMEADGNNRVKLSNNTGSDGYPRFSPDGTMLSYTHDLLNQQWEIFIMNIDGSNIRRVTESPADVTAINAVWRPN